MDKKRLFEIIEEHKQDFEEISDYVWEHPEVCFLEFESTKKQREYMKKQGFHITTPVAGMETSFIAEYGSGKPVMAILGENDALSGQSQEADYVGQKPIIAGGNGHACGHNLLGTGSMEAVCALKQLMEENRIKGTLRYYACPAEEGGGGKVFMARAGVFNDIDCAFSWHPGDDNRLDNAGLACVIFNVTFKGTAAHAAAEPWNGRSALDALELMNTGVQYLREHVTPDTRIHYAITNSGGPAENVVQSIAQARYSVRAANRAYMEEVYQRVINIAKGAALMTETTFEEPEIISSYNDFIRNDTLDELVLKNVAAILPIDYTEEELRYAASFQQHGNKKTAKAPIDMTIDMNKNRAAVYSTDVADVSYCAPISQVRVATLAAGSIGHGWTTTAQGKSSIAHKGMHAAAKTMAGCVYDLWEDDNLIKKARKDYESMMEGREYRSMVPADKKPEALG